MKNISRALIAVAAAVFSTGPALGSEENFVYVDRMPSVEGDLKSSVSARDDTSGARLAKKVFVRESDGLVVVSHRVAANCNANTGEARDKADFIVAVQFLPKGPRSFAAAGLHDFFQEVYVKDESDRIRFYANLHGRQMVELTNRFKPSCDGI